MKNEFNLTCDFLNCSQDLASTSPIYSNFKAQVRIDVPICGLVVVPGKMVAGICFPDYSKQRIRCHYPHILLAVNVWNQSDSDKFMGTLFTKKSFNTTYKALKHAKPVTRPLLQA